MDEERTETRRKKYSPLPPLKTSYIASDIFRKKILDKVQYEIPTTDIVSYKNLKCVEFQVERKL